MRVKKPLFLFLMLVMAVFLTAFAQAEEPLLITANPNAGEEIVVLYTNDAHTYIDNEYSIDEETTLPAIRYSTVARIKDSLTNVLLVDAGDHIQGTAYGGMDKGKTIIQLMNAAGYDLATLGNHEFDYGMEGAMAAMEAANFPYVSCNFHHEKDGVPTGNVLNSYQMFEVAGRKVAFVGITTPETITSTTPAYFQNEDGEYIYGIAGGEDGAELYAAVQAAVDAARSAGADYIIGLGHLGVDPSSAPWTSREVIANTTGLDAFIDGHSHTTIESEQVTDKDGETVLLTQTGSYLNAVGKLAIAADGTISTELLTADELADAVPDAEVAAIEDAWIAEINAQLGQVIGYSQVTLDNYDADGNRLVRSQETNTGDFTTDALYYLFHDMGIDVDFAVMNGGGIRNTAITGEITYQTCKEIHTFGNVACLITVTGQQILDALEWGARSVGVAEEGSFLHASGLKYTVDTTIEPTVQADDKGVWTGGPTGEYRVRDVKVLDNETFAWNDLDLEAEYHLAGYNYTLRDLGGGFAMFDGAVNVLDYVMEDYMVLANYIQAFPTDPETGLPTIGLKSEGPSFTNEVDYSDVNGMGRITVLRTTAGFGEEPAEEPAESEKQPETIDKPKVPARPAIPAEEPEPPAPEKPAAGEAAYTVKVGDCLWSIAYRFYGSGAKYTIIAEVNNITDPDYISIGQVLTIPAA